MKNKKRKFAALALCVTLLVGLLSTTFSSADDFNVPQEPIVLSGAEITNIERIQSCYNSNLKTIVTNANLVTGATSFKILEIYPGTTSTTIPTTTFSAYVEHGYFASQVLTYDGISVPADKVDLTRVTAGTLCAHGDKDAILEYLLSFDLVYVNNTDDFDKKGVTPLSNVTEDTAKMFFQTYDFTADGKDAFLEYVTQESAPLMMDYNIYKYLNPSTLPGSEVITPGEDLKLAELAATVFPTKHFASGSAHYVFPMMDNNFNGTDQILSFFESSQNEAYPNSENVPVLGTAADGTPTIDSVSHYKFLEIVPVLPATGTKTPLQQLAEEEASVEQTYTITTTDEFGEEHYEYCYHDVTRLANSFLADPSYGGTFTVEVCTPGSIPGELSGYDAVFVNIGSDDYAALSANDITDTEKDTLTAYASQGTGAMKYLYYKQSLASTYGTTGEGGTTLAAEDFAYEIILNIINTTTLQSKYSNVILVDYMFISATGMDVGKISAIQAMINTSAYKGILPSSSDRKFNVLEIQPAAPILYKNGDTDVTQYYEEKYSVDGESGIYSYHISKSKIADVIGIDESKINIDCYTVSELNCKVDDLVNTYDLVVIGGDVSALREFTNNASISSSHFMRQMEVDNAYAYDMYFHTGDITRRRDPYWDPDACKDNYGNNNSNVLIGAQRNTCLTEKGFEYVYISSGMDLSYTKQQELYNYINSGRPVLIESEVITAGNTVSPRIDPVSHMGIMLKDIVTTKNYGGYTNILTGFDYDDTKVVNGKTVYNDTTRNLIIDTINSESSIIRPTLNIISKPVEYKDTSPKSAYGVNGHIFRVEYSIGSEAGNNMDYEVNLYFDVDMDGRFSEEEIYQTQNYRTGVDKNKSIEYELVDTFFGILSWKLEATYTSSGAVTKVSQLGYAGYDRGSGVDAPPEELKVLQIIPSHYNCNLRMCVNCDNGWGCDGTHHTFGIAKYNGGNTGNWMSDFVFKDYFDIQLKIIEANNFCEMAYDNHNAIGNENWLIDNYDMIVIGFADSYDKKDFSKIACAELIKFSEVNSLLCSHDNIGIVNAGARYDKGKYGLGDYTSDPDHYSRSLTTWWSYNMGHYYNPGDSIYDSSIRYVFGAARFFTLDPANPYTNRRDGSEFYTNYYVNYAPSASFMSGVYGGQTDVCLGWRIGVHQNLGPDSDTYSEDGKAEAGYNTSPYKNDTYVGHYNNTQFTRVTNDGIITRYPFALPERFKIDTTHAQYAQLDLDIESTTVWYSLDSTSDSEYWNGSEAKNKAYKNSYYTINPNDGRNSYYIYSNKNVTYTGAGHSDITPLFDNNYERKLFINTVFLAFNARNNPPVIRVFGDNIDTSPAAKINDGGVKVDAQASVSSSTSLFEYDLQVIDDLADRYFTGYIYVDAIPNGGGYDYWEGDKLVGIIKYGADGDDVIYYDLLKNGEKRRMTGLQLKEEYFDEVTDFAHISIQIFDRFPYSKSSIIKGEVSTQIYEQQSLKTLSSVYTIRIKTEGVVDMNLWELN